MNTIQGAVSDIQRQTLAGGTRVNFRLHSANGKDTAVETLLDFPYTDADVVQVSGEFNSDLVLLASVISPVSRPAPVVRKPIPWLWIGLAAALLILVVVVIGMLSGSRGSTVTIVAERCGTPAPGAVIHLVGPDGVSTPACSANASAQCVFRGLKKGSYDIIVGTVAMGKTAALDGKHDLTKPIPVNTISILLCHPIPIKKYPLRVPQSIH